MLIGATLLEREFPECLKIVSESSDFEEGLSREFKLQAHSSVKALYDLRLNFRFLPP